MNILVTGGAGYIGSLLVPNLLSQGHSVTVIDNFMYRQTSLASSIRDVKLTLVFGDVRDESLMKTHLAKADVIIPLAAIVGAPACDSDPIAAQSINKDSILWLLKQLSPNQRIIMPTTNSAYGSGDQNNYCDENSPLNPLSLYARDKVTVEKALMDLPNATSFRLATVFGISPRMRLDLLVNNFAYRAITDGFVVVTGNSSATAIINILTDAANPPTTSRQQISASDANGSSVAAMCPVKKGNYYLVTVSAGTVTVYFIPIGS
jgi:nucleoside-diphosphate-sugar epimerase